MMVTRMTSKSNVVTIYDKKQNKEIKYYLDERLRGRLDGIKNDLKRKDKDCFIAVDGNEGSGGGQLTEEILDDLIEKLRRITKRNINQHDSGNIVFVFNWEI